MAFRARCEVVLVMAGRIAPLYAHFGQVNRPRCRKRGKRVRGMAVGAFGNINRPLRIMRYILMWTDLFRTGRHIFGGRRDDLVKGGSVTIQTNRFWVVAELQMMPCIDTGTTSFGSWPLPDFETVPVVGATVG